MIEGEMPGAVVLAHANTLTPPPQLVRARSWLTCAWTSVVVCCWSRRRQCCTEGKVQARAVTWAAVVENERWPVAGRSRHRTSFFKPFFYSFLEFLKPFKTFQTCFEVLFCFFFFWKMVLSFWLFFIVPFFFFFWFLFLFFRLFSFFWKKTLRVFSLESIFVCSPYFVLKRQQDKKWNRESFLTRSPNLSYLITSFDKLWWFVITYDNLS